MKKSRLETLLSQAESIPRSKLPISIKLKFWLCTLVYHSSFSFSYTVDALLEPLFWFIDNFGKFLGRIFVGAVILLISIVVMVAHILGIPIWWYRSPQFTCILFIVGYWILVNLMFNFIQAVRVSPGLPNDTQLLAKTMNVTICKKCISPKPPRTHHCSICNRCYLNMCHHCPWINNCVGHFNRRYFYLTMVYIVIGCCFIMLFGLEIAYQQIILDTDVLPFSKTRYEDGRYNLLSSMESLVPRLFRRFSLAVELVIPGNVIIPNELSKPASPGTDDEEERAELLFGILVTRSELLTMIYFVALLCIGASLALAGLAVWHGKLISKGETSIEYHINKAERKKVGSSFVNPYDLGLQRNWELFFGLDQHGKSFVRHVLLPSAHIPTGNGYDWDHLTNCSHKSS